MPAALARSFPLGSEVAIVTLAVGWRTLRLPRDPLSGWRRQHRLVAAQLREKMQQPLGRVLPQGIERRPDRLPVSALGGRGDVVSVNTLVIRGCIDALEVANLGRALESPHVEGGDTQQVREVERQIGIRDGAEALGRELIANLQPDSEPFQQLARIEHLRQSRSRRLPDTGVKGSDELPRR